MQRTWVFLAACDSSSKCDNVCWLVHNEFQSPTVCYKYVNSGIICNLFAIHYPSIWSPFRVRLWQFAGRPFPFLFVDYSLFIYCSFIVRSLSVRCLLDVHFMFIIPHNNPLFYSEECWWRIVMSVTITVKCVSRLDKNAGVTEFSKNWVAYDKWKVGVNSYEFLT